MTNWTEIEIVSDGVAAAEIVLASSSDDGALRIVGGDAELAGIARDAGFEPKPGRWLDVLPSGSRKTRAVLLGCAPGDAESWIALGGYLNDALTSLRLASVRLPDSDAFASRDDFENLLLGTLLNSFRYETGRRTPDPIFQPEHLVIAPGDAALAADAQRTAKVVNRARAWVEAPANRLTPVTWAAEVKALDMPGLVARILVPDELAALGAHAILAVGRGAEHGPRLAILEWRGAAERDGWDAVIVGKGLTFDGGGLNLKSRPSIEKMKFDMSGGAAALGAVELAASRQARCNVAAVVPMAENAIDAFAYRPGDVIGSLSGLTIEVLNTDTEGRLVLADGVTYGRRTYAPTFIVDIATLTGMIMGVLHEEFAAVYANDDTLAEALATAGEAVGERLWRMPLVASQDYLVESSVADVANLGAPGLLGTSSGSPAAGAKLIQKFAEGARWAHIDIAGAAWATHRNAVCTKGATGFGVRLLERWLRCFE